MTRDWFDAQMARLIGLRFVPADLETHWEGLRDLPEATLERAITRAIKTRDEFPSPHELREDADAVGFSVQPEEDRGVDLCEPMELGTLPTGTPIRATRTWRFYCDVCNDQGWRSFWCGEEPSIRYPWLPVQACQSRNCAKVHYGHDWTEPCPCAERNPAVRRRKEKAQKYAEKRAKGAA